MAASAELVAFTDAILKGDDAARAEQRDRLVAAVGAEGAVDAAAVVANFEMMNRIADSTGIPLDTVISIASQDLQEEMDLNRFASAAHTPKSGTGKRLVKKALGPLFRAATPYVGKLISRD